jgi:glycosyltransferase involved in cell wall biosynthesis
MRPKTAMPLFVYSGKPTNTTTRGVIDALKLIASDGCKFETICLPYSNSFSFLPQAQDFLLPERKKVIFADFSVFRQYCLLHKKCFLNYLSKCQISLILDPYYVCHELKTPLLSQQEHDERKALSECLVHTDIIVAPSRIVRDTLLNFKIPGLHSDKFRIARRGTIYKKSSFCTCEEIKDKPAQLLTVSSSMFSRGVLKIPEIAVTLRDKNFDFCWTIVGGTPNNGWLQYEIECRKLQNFVVQQPWLDPTLLPLAYDSADLFVYLPNFEELAYNLMDASMLGVPILTNGAGAIGEVFKKNETAFFAPNNDPGHISREIIRICNDCKSRNRVARNAHRMVKNNYNIKNYAGLMTEILF